MERNDTETHDFMNVESFSQLPFIRPSPLKEKSIRLFGKEFGGGAGADDVIISVDDADSTETATDVVIHEESKDVGESNRKFECNYCCRNFPTSQALGGHQNAHKRERQHAKRAHLQSAMIHGTFTEAQMYGTLMNYHRITTHIPPPYYHHQPPPSTTNNIAYTSSRFNYGGINNSYYTSHQTPINGSPLAMWKFPRNSTFSDDSKASIIGSGNHSQIRYAYEQKPNVQEQVSLDLHL
ncbi:hypothetical protein L6452_09617 [Arctium lappa]|uniref:Uncharacterized protein n=1 Tax=Arctium lappa TaxID=4217 RepID=A0ACB9DLD9_ARCLA|nr:hypothetical protein L6452_09617 [Arctium lappa]